MYLTCCRGVRSRGTGYGAIQANITKLVRKSKTEGLIKHINVDEFEFIDDIYEAHKSHLEDIHPNQPDSDLLALLGRKLAKFALLKTYKNGPTIMLEISMEVISALYAISILRRGRWPDVKTRAMKTKKFIYKEESDFIII